jgi:hypothetical protein
VRTLWLATIFSFALIGGPIPSAHAQAVTTFDGTYIGVSMTASPAGALGVSCHVPPNARGRPLTISGGVARHDGGFTGDLHYQGTVTASGSLMLRDGMAHIIAAQIDPSGKITGSGGGSSCVITNVWQKRS